MPRPRSRSRLARPAGLALLLAAALPLAAGAEGWPQWGGPSRDFHVDTPPLLTHWPAAGPEVLWRRPLGEGYSAVAVDDHRLYTMHREGDHEIVAAWQRRDGAPLWQQRYAAPHLDGMRMGYGGGPHATPLLVDGLVLTAGATGIVHALDAATGAVRWRRALWGELGGSFLRRGYAASPLAWGETVILPVGGENQGLVAFARADGSVRWQSQTLTASQSSPILAEVGGRTQLVAFVADQVVAVDPGDGALLWQHEHPAGAVYNISTPVYGDDGLLVVSSAYGGGSRGLELGWRDGAATVTERFLNKRLKVHFTNAVRIGDHLYGSSGNASVVFLAALDLRSGELAWKERRIGRANLLLTRDHTVVALGESGELSLIGLYPAGLVVHAQTQLLEGEVKTPPSLVGNVLYLRDRRELLAVALPVAPEEPAAGER